MATPQRKWYVVWVGRAPGIYPTWSECERQVKGFPRAKFKSFTSEPEAKQAFNGVGQAKSAPKPSAPTKRATTKRTAVAPKALKAVDVEIFCDGACDPNPGPSGSGISLYRQGVLSSLYYGHFSSIGTNNTAELLALYEALSLAKTAIAAGDRVRIRADSQYAIKCISVWAKGWKKRGWRRPKNEPVKNLDIIQPAYELYCEVAADIELTHVKAHAGIEGNELADRMAMKASMEQQVAFVQYHSAMDVKAILGFQRG